MRGTNCSSSSNSSNGSNSNSSSSNSNFTACQLASQCHLRMARP